ncbi:hypothetical protein O9992_20715 [Vibrio lentus]|nr:hypothetical protein [Vibrio lentus]
MRKYFAVALSVDWKPILLSMMTAGPYSDTTEVATEETLYGKKSLMSGH